MVLIATKMFKHTIKRRSVGPEELPDISDKDKEQEWRECVCIRDKRQGTAVGTAFMELKGCSQLWEQSYFHQEHLSISHQCNDVDGGDSEWEVIETDVTVIHNRCSSR